MAGEQFKNYILSQNTQSKCKYCSRMYCELRIIEKETVCKDCFLKKFLVSKKRFFYDSFNLNYRKVNDQKSRKNYILSVLIVLSIVFINLIFFLGFSYGMSYIIEKFFQNL
ncbi:MAG: hypothetical protein ACRDCG_01660 [Mycoplasmoidaceae bacterium]